jgi:hypothetical protein
LTVEIMRWRTANSAWEWLGSIFQLVATAAAVVVIISLSSVTVWK